MTKECPQCKSKRGELVIGRAAEILQHFECQDCGHRWTIEVRGNARMISTRSSRRRMMIDKHGPDEGV